MITRFVFCDVLAICGAASDYRKRRKSEPFVTQQSTGNKQNAGTILRLEPYKSNSLKKPAVRSSPSSPAKAKGTHAQSSLQVVVMIFSIFHDFPCHCASS